MAASIGATQFRGSHSLHRSVRPQTGGRPRAGQGRGREVVPLAVVAEKGAA